MIDLTPLDVRKKKGDFRRGVRGYDPEAVDLYLEHVADRLEELVRENLSLRERSTQLAAGIESFRERERAMNEALISAQQLREETRAQASREAELTLREARAEAERILEAARRELAAAEEGVRRVQSQRVHFLRSFRSLVERHLGEVEQEEERLRALLEADIELPARGKGKEGGWLAAIDSPPTGTAG